MHTRLGWLLAAAVSVVYLFSNSSLIFVAVACYTCAYVGEVWFESGGTFVIGVFLAAILQFLQLAISGLAIEASFLFYLLFFLNAGLVLICASLYIIIIWPDARYRCALDLLCGTSHSRGGSHDGYRFLAMRGLAFTDLIDALQIVYATSVLPCVAVLSCGMFCLLDDAMSGGLYVAVLMAVGMWALDPVNGERCEARVATWKAELQASDADGSGVDEYPYAAISDSDSEGYDESVDEDLAYTDDQPLRHREAVVSGHVPAPSPKREHSAPPRSSAPHPVSAPSGRVVPLDPAIYSVHWALFWVLPSTYFLVLRSPRLMSAQYLSEWVLVIAVQVMLRVGLWVASGWEDKPRASGSSQQLMQLVRSLRQRLQPVSARLGLCLCAGVLWVAVYMRVVRRSLLPFLHYFRFSGRRLPGNVQLVIGGSASNTVITSATWLNSDFLGSVFLHGAVAAALVLLYTAVTSWAVPDAPNARRTAPMSHSGLNLQVQSKARAVSVPVTVRVAAYTCALCSCFTLLGVGAPSSLGGFAVAECLLRALYHRRIHFLFVPVVVFSLVFHSFVARFVMLTHVSLGQWPVASGVIGYVFGDARMSLNALAVLICVVFMLSLALGVVLLWASQLIPSGSPSTLAVWLPALLVALGVLHSVLLFMCEYVCVHVSEAGFYGGGAVVATSAAGVYLASHFRQLAASRVLEENRMCVLLQVAARWMDVVFIGKAVLLVFYANQLGSPGISGGLWAAGSDIVQSVGGLSDAFAIFRLVLVLLTCWDFVSESTASTHHQLLVEMSSPLARSVVLSIITLVCVECAFGQVAAVLLGWAGALCAHVLGSNPFFEWYDSVAFLTRTDEAGAVSDTSQAVLQCLLALTGATLLCGPLLRVWGRRDGESSWLGRWVGVARYRRDLSRTLPLVLAALLGCAVLVQPAWIFPRQWNIVAQACWSGESAQALQSLCSLQSWVLVVVGNLVAPWVLILTVGVWIARSYGSALPTVGGQRPPRSAQKPMSLLLLMTVAVCVALIVVSRLLVNGRLFGSLPPGAAWGICIFYEAIIAFTLLVLLSYNTKALLLSVGVAVCAVVATVLWISFTPSRLLHMEMVSLYVRDLVLYMAAVGAVCVVVVLKGLRQRWDPCYEYLFRDHLRRSGGQPLSSRTETHSLSELLSASSQVKQDGSRAGERPPRSSLLYSQLVVALCNVLVYLALFCVGWVWTVGNGLTALHAVSATVRSAKDLPEAHHLPSVCFLVAPLLLALLQHEPTTAGFVIDDSNRVLTAWNILKAWYPENAHPVSPMRLAYSWSLPWSRLPLGFVAFAKRVYWRVVLVACSLGTFYHTFWLPWAVYSGWYNWWVGLQVSTVQEGEVYDAVLGTGFSFYTFLFDALLVCVGTPAAWHSYLYLSQSLTSRLRCAPSSAAPLMRRGVAVDRKVTDQSMRVIVSAPCHLLLALVTHVPVVRMWSVLTMAVSACNIYDNYAVL